ncbi:MAG: hypothetical protein WC813_03545 [Patescibacteria group bacterium]|jgi:hypothetical protein
MTKETKLWNASVLLWMIAPVLTFLGILAVERLLFTNTDDGSIMLFAAVGSAALCIAAELFLVRSALLRQEKYGFVLFFAALLQFLIPLSLVIALSHAKYDGDALVTLAFIAGFNFFITVLEILALAVFSAIVKILQHTRHSSRAEKVLLAGAILSIHVAVLFPVLILLITKPPHHKTATPSYLYDASSVDFRRDEKVKTTLGQLPRPLKIFRKADEFFAMSPTGQTVSLPFMENVDADAGKFIFFDVYTDRVYYEQHGDVMMLDINSKKIKKLPDAFTRALKEESCFSTMVANCNPRHILGAHNNELALGFQGDVAVINIETGERTNTSYEGGDYGGLYFFWVNSKGYRLFLDTHPAIREQFSRADEQIGNILWVYFDDKGDAYKTLGGEDFGPDRWGSVIYGGGERSYFFKDKTPVLTLKTDFPSSNSYSEANKSQFSVRELYLLDEKSVGLVIENKLIVINLVDKEARIVRNQKEIERLISGASLLSVDYGSYLGNNCVWNKDAEIAAGKDGARDIFCLQ